LALLEVDMQLNADNRGPLDSDDIDDITLDDSDILELDTLPMTASVVATSQELLARRRRAEDMLEARRLREELGDDDFSF
jgi:hypothetical protein